MSNTCNHTTPNILVKYRAGGKAVTVEPMACSVCGQRFGLSQGGPAQASFTLKVVALSETAPPPPKKASPVPLGEGPGTELSQELLRLGLPSCQACKDLAHRMNQWGSETCREKIDEIVADVLPRARVWFDNTSLRGKLKVWWADSQRLRMAMMFGLTAKKGKLDAALKKVIHQKVLEAADRWDRRQTDT